MEFSNEEERHNFKCQLAEGALYLSSRPLLSPETMFPALIYQLGGNDIAVGLVPVIVYLAFYLPQIFGANHFSYIPIRQKVVVKGGFIQRLHIFFIALVVGMLGASYPSLALFLVLLLYASNQATSGLITPSWGEFVAKTVSPAARGKLLGLRTSLGALFGFLNGFIIVAVLGTVSFPWSYSAIFIFAGILQMSSLIAQKRVIEAVPSPTKQAVSPLRLYVIVRKILRRDKIFKRFLIASSFLVVSFMSVAFFTVDALKKFSLDQQYVGLFTVITVISQVLSAASLGWLADRKGSKTGLVVTGAALLMATVIALVAQSAAYYYVVFFLIGVNIGGESFLRYNIAVEFAPLEERALYVGLMNAWLAPFYLSNLIAGWVSSYVGYVPIYLFSVLFGVVGLYLLFKLPKYVREQN